MPRRGWTLCNYDSDGEVDFDFDMSSGESSSGSPKRKKREDNKVYLKTKFTSLFKRLAKVSTGECEAEAFVVTGPLTDIPYTGIVLNDGTVLKFPLSERELGAVIPVMEQSPFGRGEFTILDKTFRNSWQLNPDQFQIENEAWKIYIDEVLVPKIGSEMGLDGPFTANLYKLLAYKEGSFFKAHRDTEKEDGMFATLVVQLRSKYSGGTLVVRHDGMSKVIDYSADASPANVFSLFYSAFYCDCEHEILPVTGGVRVCLVYNLIMRPNSVIPKAPGVSHLINSLKSLVGEWRGMKQDEVQPDDDSHHKKTKTPSKLVYLLEHKYSERNLSLGNLKGGDKALASAMSGSEVEGLGLTVTLGILGKETRRHDCYDGSDSSDPDNCEDQSDYAIKSFRPFNKDAEGVIKDCMRASKLRYINAEWCEVFPEDRRRTLKHYNRDVEETGNEGTHFSYQYRSAVIVILLNETVLRNFLFNVAVHSFQDENPFGLHSLKGVTSKLTPSNVPVLFKYLDKYPITRHEILVKGKQQHSMVISGMLTAATAQGGTFTESQLKIARHFLNVLKKRVNKTVPPLSEWKTRSDFRSCSSSCAECQQVQTFMISHDISREFPFVKARREHILKQLKFMSNVTHVTFQQSMLVVTKNPRTIDAKQADELENDKKLVEKLGQIIASSEQKANGKQKQDQPEEEIPSSRSKGKTTKRKRQ